MIEKYGTIEIWRNILTGEIVEILPNETGYDDPEVWERLEDEEEKVAETQQKGVIDG